MRCSASACVRRAAAVHSTPSLQGAVPATAMLASSLTSSTRSFVQGAPPLPQRVTDKNNKERPRGSYREEMDSERARRQRAIHEFFATHEPNCPEPLEENAFVKGQFGMRRRYFVDHRGKIDSIALGAAVADSTNAMRK